MQIEIEHLQLIDSPYSGLDNSIFVFDEEEVKDIANDVQNGNPTCYLVSGYRGVGKTSFIKKLESYTAKDSSIVFVHTSFAKYSDQSYLIRKLIRQLYLKIEPIKKYKELAKDLGGKELMSKLAILHQRTFHEVSESISKSDLRESEFRWGFDKVSLKELLGVVFPGTILFGYALNRSIDFVSLKLIPLLTFIWFLIGVFSLSYWKTKRKSEEQSLLSKTLYDDEIAGYHFYNILSELHKRKFKIIFVLDELDKIEREEVDSLIKEMKPFLVSGMASFIVVSGQQLFYKFYEDQTKDDSVLSSLFSKLVHVPLSTQAALKLMFVNRIIKNMKDHSVEDQEKIYKILDYYIYKSRLVPRRFISLIRQNVYWKDGKAYLKDYDLPKDFELASQVLSIIGLIDENYIRPDSLNRCLRDYMVMNLFIHSSDKFQESKLKL